MAKTLEERVALIESWLQIPAVHYADAPVVEEAAPVVPAVVIPVAESPVSPVPVVEAPVVVVAPAPATPTPTGWTA